MTDNKEVFQVGLFSESSSEVKTLAERVAKFNERRMSNVTLDIEPHDKGDAECPRPHFKLRLKFPNHDVQDAFWLE